MDTYPGNMPKLDLNYAMEADQIIAIVMIVASGRMTSMHESISFSHPLFLWLLSIELVFFLKDRGISKESNSTPNLL